MALLQDLAARSGNKKELQELIETRSRLLSAERGASENLIKDILAQVPTKAANYNKLQETKATEAATRDAAFKLTWQPLIRFILDEFDRSINQLRANNVVVTTEGNNGFALTNADGSQLRSASVRLARCDNVSLNLYYRGFPAMATSEVGASDARMYLFTEDTGARPPHETPVWFQVVMEEHAIRLQPPNGPETTIAAPEIGLPPKAVTDFVQRGMARGIEELLVLSKARETAAKR